MLGLLKKKGECSKKKIKQIIPAGRKNLICSMLSVLHDSKTSEVLHLVSVYFQWPCVILQLKSQFFFSWSSEDKGINFGAGKSQTWQVQNNLIIKKQHKRPTNSF